MMCRFCGKDDMAYFAAPYTSGAILIHIQLTRYCRHCGSGEVWIKPNSLTILAGVAQ